ncbi:hypothetical protein PENDEC_c011G01481 [Penicillium decumbens]|uniref:Glycosyltransferase 2-like domain-containing protein n=1 Tax=Penicillium decumbens TaxID=69771 RepID=A0A1V6PBA2_PENDC|nr:hypothetical protein PENDEC_c011G01481 [Penicillium decumbens]
MLGWITRCRPGFSIIGLVLPLVCAFFDILMSSLWSSFFPPSSSPVQGGLNIVQRAFVLYIVIHIHMLDFPLRLGWSIFRATGKAKTALDRRIWHTPLSSPQTEIKSDVTVNEVIEEELVHAVIVPNYCEGIYTLETTLKVLASHPRAKSQYEIYLAMEQKEDSSSDKAGHLVTKFERSFLHICITFHPSGVKGEIAGTSSNVAFAARRIVEIHRTDLNEDSCNVVVTVMDADTHLSRDYFTEIRRLHLPTSTRQTDPSTAVPSSLVETPTKAPF